MRTRQEAIEYGLSFPDTYEEAPFHDLNWQLVRYKENKKAFLWTYERDGLINLNVKVKPEKAYLWRSIYPAVIPAYHQNKDHWNTVILDGTIENSEELDEADIRPLPVKSITWAGIGNGTSDLEQEAAAE